MIKIEIKRASDNVVGWGSRFETQALADAWIAQEMANNSWGKPDRWLSSEFSVDMNSVSTEYVPNEDISQAVENRIVIDREAVGEILDENGDVITPAISEVSHKEYHFSAEYVVVQTDLGNSVEMEQVRIKRDQILSSCDWTQLVDSPLDSAKKAEWATYRQSLRDLPDQTGFDPLNPTWPNQPV